MIVNYTEIGWEIILQRAHGSLAAQIAAHWKKEERPKCLNKVCWLRKCRKMFA